jgi:hypothetical protein
MARGLSVPTLRMWKVMGGARHPVAVFELRLSDLSDCWHFISGHADASVRLVSGDVVCDQPEKWGQRAGLADWVVMGPPGRGCTNCGAQWFDPVAIG